MRRLLDKRERPKDAFAAFHLYAKRCTVYTILIVYVNEAGKIEISQYRSTFSLGRQGFKQILNIFIYLENTR